MEFHKLVLGPLGTNCYILADEETKKATIIDAPDEAETILAFLQEKGYTVSEIVLTHGHFDHILALKKLKEKTHAPVWSHQNTTTFLQDGIYNLCHYVGVPWTPIQPDRFLQDGERLCLGGMEFQVLHTPGHTSDCICLYGDGILLAGDTLFQGSVGRVDHPTGNLEQEVESIKNKLMPLPEETRVYPGHGPATTIGEERRGNPYLQ